MWRRGDRQDAIGIAADVSGRPDAQRPVRGTTAALRGGATYSLAIVVQGMAQFLLLPVYTRVFTSSQYGELGVAISIALFANAFLSFGLELAVIRTYFDLRPSPEQQRSAMATLGVATLVLPLAGAALLSLIAVPLLDGTLTPSQYLVLALLGSGIFVSATVLPVALLRAEDRLRDYLIVYATLIVSNIVLTALFVLAFHWGPAGSLLGTLVANALGLATAAYVLPWPRPKNLNRAYLFAALAIGLPMVPHLVSGWALQLSDRAILGGLVSHAQVGVYSLAVNLAVPVMMVMSAVSQAVHPSYGGAIHDPRARDKLPELVHIQIIVTCLITATAALLGPVVVSAVIPASYAGAARLIPWLALGYGLWGLYSIPMNAISILAGRTTWVWTVTVVTAALRIGGLYWLVPDYGIVAAAIALPVCNLVLVGGISLVAHRTTGTAVTYDWLRGALVVAASLMLIVPVAVLEGHDSALDIGVRVLVLALLPVAFLLGGGTSKDQRRRLLASARALLATATGDGRPPTSARR
jgi:O-antigen/teichoic acid export membrane protein